MSKGFSQIRECERGPSLCCAHLFAFVERYDSSIRIGKSAPGGIFCRRRNLRRKRACCYDRSCSLRRERTRNVLTEQAKSYCLSYPPLSCDIHCKLIFDGHALSG